MVQSQLGIYARYVRACLHLYAARPAMTGNGLSKKALKGTEPLIHEALVALIRVEAASMRAQVGSWQLCFSFCLFLAVCH